MARDAGTRRARRRHIRAGRALDAHLLPAILPGPPTVAAQRHFLPHARGSRKTRLSSLSSLPTERNGRLRGTCHARGKISCAVARRGCSTLGTCAQAQFECWNTSPRLPPSYRPCASRTGRSFACEALQEFASSGEEHHRRALRNRLRLVQPRL